MKASRLAEIATGTKLCKRCGETKPLDDFPIITNRGAKVSGAKTWTYPRPECAACLAEQKAATFQRMKETYRPRIDRYYAANLDRQSLHQGILRAVKRGATVVTVTLDEWRALRNVRNCHWCGMELHPSFRHIDHVTPLSRGGQHTADNLVASCANCNHRRAWEQQTKFKDQHTKDWD